MHVVVDILLTDAHSYVKAYLCIKLSYKHTDRQGQRPMLVNCDA